MDRVYRRQGLTFEWDAEKAEANRIKHGVAFEEAVEVLFDPFVILGDASAGDEIREWALGYSMKPRLLLVFHLERGTNTRIVSARPATAEEARMYGSKR